MDATLMAHTYDSAEIITVGGKVYDFPSNQYVIEHTKKFGEPVLLVRQIANPPAYGDTRVRPVLKSKQRLQYFIIQNIVSVSYRYYL